MGTLLIKGLFPFDQFWPNGKEDADIAKLKLDNTAFQLWPASLCLKLRSCDQQG